MSLCPELNSKMPLIEYLAEDLLARILVRLPVKYILRCMCVQKSWRYLIQAPMFITLHLNYQKPNAHNPNPKYLFFKNAYSLDSTIRVDQVQCQEYSTLKFLPALPGKSAWHAPSYGLICTATLMSSPPLALDNNIYLWNPLIQKYKTLPESPLVTFTHTEWKGLAFGFVPEINDYLVVHIVKPKGGKRGRGRNPHSVIIGVYSLNTNAWKKLSQDNVSLCAIDYRGVVFVNGAAFWMGINSARKRKLIMCFDTKTDILREISLPKSGPSPIPVLHQFGQSSIAYFVWDDRYDFCDMWILKYNSINEFSWEKKMHIKTTYGVNIKPSKDLRVEVLGVRNNGEPILARFFNLVSYNLDNNEESNFVDSWDSWTPHHHYRMGMAPPFHIRPFVESLVLLNDD